MSGDLEVNGTTTTLNTQNLDVEDTNITLNKNGSDASSEGSGITTERVGTNGAIEYETALDNKYKVGAVGSLKEIMTIVKDTQVNLDALPSYSSSVLYYATDNQTHYRSDGVTLLPLGSGSGGGGGGDIEKTQAAHGFVLLDGIYHDGTNWLKGLANNNETLSEYVVTEIIDANTFKAAKFGELEVIGHGLTVGQYYYQSDVTAGGSVSTEPSGFSNPLFYVETANIIQLAVYRPSLSSTANVLLESTLTDDESWAPTFNSFGTPTDIDAKWHREGKYMMGTVSFRASQVDNGLAWISLPSSYTVDFGIVETATTIMGRGHVVPNASSYIYDPDLAFSVIGLSSNADRIYIVNRTNSAVNPIPMSSTYIRPSSLSAATATNVMLKFKIPITEFSIGSGFLGALPFDATVINGTPVSSVAPTDNQILTYDNGSGEWVAETPAGGGGGGASKAVIYDVKGQNDGGGSFTSGAFRTRDLNTLNDPSSIVTSLSANQFVLPAGTYHIISTAPAYHVNRHQSRLRNITDATDVVLGDVSSANPSSLTVTKSTCSQVIVIASPKTFELQHLCQTTVTTNGFGLDSAFAANSIFSIVTITKLS